MRPLSIDDAIAYKFAEGSLPRSGLGFWVCGLGFMVEGWGLGFRGLGF